ncbi:unnamed protein product [Didymodactylos carnosus]|uniref:Uncharacterized protein n=1 Tax=Didymodactylos carnosus TaxID=1234261 RepID=A0A815S1T2_9BILA|nr:unnamed protein product [Didymodactylos carnosus]CAF1485761.1 unnamed protein product [Didymodactylos carnosus]CAF4159895.1 unnamed protein product [Didymodactylos carnosus]CAF4349864.1 unnamed protein product [Didymodactylos carnosus]
MSHYKILTLTLFILVLFKHVNNLAIQQSITAGEKVLLKSLKSQLNDLIATFKKQLIAKFILIDNTTITPLLATFAVMKKNLNDIPNLPSCLAKQEPVLNKSVNTIIQMRTTVKTKQVQPELLQLTKVANGIINNKINKLLQTTTKVNVNSLVNQTRSIRTDINNILLQSLKIIGQLRNIVNTNFGFIFNMFSVMVTCILHANNNKLQIYNTFLTSTEKGNGLTSSLDGQLSSLLGDLQDYSITFGRVSLETIDDILYKITLQLI